MHFLTLFQFPQNLTMFEYFSKNEHNGWLMCLDDKMVDLHDFSDLMLHKIYWNSKIKISYHQNDFITNMLDYRLLFLRP